MPFICMPSRVSALYFNKIAMACLKNEVSATQVEKLRITLATLYNAPVLHRFDCENLAESIYEKTRQRLSYKTLQRFFGTVPTSSLPAVQTLNILAQYCGYQNWYAFQQNPAATHSQTQPEAWEAIQAQARHLTVATLRSIQSRSGLAFRHTISRGFAISKLEQFMAAPVTAFAFYAPGGYGKSTLLSHWVETHTRQHPEDVIWLINDEITTLLLQKDFELKSWFVQQIGFEGQTSRLEYYRLHPEKRKGNFLLVLDSVADHRNKVEEQLVYYRQLLAFMSVSEDYPFLKIIITCRLSVWQGVALPVIRTANLQSRWYNFNQPETELDNANIELLETPEIEQILENCGISALFFTKVSLSVQKLLKIPFFLQLFIQASSHLNQSDTSQQIEYNELDLLDDFFRRRIFQTTFQSEKSDLLSQFLVCSDVGKKGNNILKNDLKFPYPDSHTAYRELVSEGVLRERDIENKFLAHETRVYFGHNNLFEFYLFTFLILENGGVTPTLVYQIYEIYQDKDLVFNLTRWMLLWAFKNNHVDFLKELFNISVIFQGKDHGYFDIYELMNVLGTQLRKSEVLRRQLLPVYASHTTAHTFYFELFVDTDELVLHHHHAIRLYQEHKQTPEAQLFSNCMLFLYAFLAHKPEELKAYLQKANAISITPDIHPIPIGRRIAYNLIYQHYEGGGIRDELIKEVFDIEKRMPNTGKFSRYIPFYHIYTAFGLIWSNKYAEALALIKLAEDRYPALESFLYPSDNMYHALALWKAKALLETQKTAEAQDVFSRINPQHFNFYDTGFYTVQYYIFLADFFEKQHNIAKVTAYLNRALQIAVQYHFQFFYSHVAQRLHKSANYTHSNTSVSPLFVLSS